MRERNIINHYCPLKKRDRGECESKTGWLARVSTAAGFNTILAGCMMVVGYESEGESE